MPGGFVSQGNVLRLSPLAAAVASSKSQQGSQTSLPGGRQLDGASVASQQNQQPQLSEAELADLQQRASQGDQEALSLLEALGYVAGTAGAAGGGYLLYKALKNRGQGASQASVTPSSAPQGSSSRELSIPVTQVQEEIIPRTSGQVEQYKYKGLPKQERLLPNIPRITRALTR